MRVRTGPGLVLGLHAAAAFLAAMLLFSLEPLIGKQVLPRLGGAPAVWNTCLLFFQGMLLAGYAYAHYGVERLGVGRHASVHAVLLVASLLLLPPGVTESAAPVAGSPVWWLLGALLRAIGLPFLLISATAPLVQRWFSESEHPAAGDPYFLYAASNLGSLVGLALYPLVLEPLLGLRVQGLLWSLVYVGFVGLLGYLAARARVSPSDVRATAPSVRERVAPVTAARWTGIAAVPSALLLAVTGYVTTDVAPMPLLWLLPLAIYLATFVVAFGARRARGLWLATRVQPVLTVLLGAAILSGFNASWMLAVHLVALGCVAYLAHARLAAERPRASQLTAFYLWLSVGGTLGGVFGVVVAPLLLMPETEYVLLLLLALLLPAAGRVLRFVSLRAGLAATVACGVAGMALAVSGNKGLALTLFAIPAVIFLIEGVARGPRSMVLVCGVLLMLFQILNVVTETGTVLTRSRNFFGTLRVRDFPAYRALMHGRTLHGVQLKAAAEMTTPTAYFTREGPLGDLFRTLPGGRARVGVVGLGAGTAACFGQPGERWEFFEIDPAVVEIASDPRYFHFLERCAEGAEIVIGDGRRSLADRPEASYDLLVLDAFSSDAIPVHLLTVDAFRLYLERLNSHGIVGVHISNKYLDLAPVIAANAQALGLQARIRADDVLDPPRRAPSTWVALARTQASLAALGTPGGWQPLLPERGFRLWTDDYASLLSVLRALR